MQRFWTVPILLMACVALVAIEGQGVSAQTSAASPSLLDRYTSVSESMLLDPPPGEWLMWRRTYNHWGYSPLDQVDRDNVATLRLAWAWTMERGLQETTPLVHDGVMFLVQAASASDAMFA